MRRPKLLAILLLVAGALARPIAGQPQETPGLEARVWLDRGEEPVLRGDDLVRVYYRTSEDAYAAIFRIDTDGAISMVFPQHPGVIARVRGGRDYRLLFPGGTVWLVGDDPGVGYYFMVASLEPLDFSSFRYDQRLGWDLGSVGDVVYEDPYVAIDDYVAALVPGWETVPYALDFLTYHVGNTYSYPRFLCYDCHGERPYASWNPYDAVCTSFRVVIWDDPYFYPAYRYSGTSVVVARPPRALPRYEVVARAPGDIGVRPLVRSRPAPERRVAQFKEAPWVPESSRVPVRRSPSASQRAQQPGSRVSQEPPEGASARPTLQPRGGASLSTRTPAPADASPSSRARASSTPRGDRVGRPSGALDAGTDRAAGSGAERPASPSTSRSAPARRAPSATQRQDADRAAAGGSTASPRARAAAPGRQTAGSAPARVPTARAAETRPGGRPSTPSTSRPTATSGGRPAARPSAAPRAPVARPAVRPRATARGN